MDYKKQYIKYKNKYNSLKNRPLKKEDKVKYKETNDIVSIIQVHNDDSEPYYTIRMKDGTEKQTIRSKLL